MAKTNVPVIAGSATERASLLYQYLPARPVHGNIFYVCSANANAGDTTGKGVAPDAPFATIDYAVGRCTADNDDMIVVLPGHTETVTAAAGLALDVAGVSILGVGYGRQRPRINYTTATAASLDVTAARCSIENVTFTNGIDGQTAMLNVQAADFSLIGCEFDHGNSSTQAVQCVLTTASASRMLVQNCFFHGTTDAGTTAAITIVGGDSIRLVENVFTGAYTSGVGAVQQTTTTTTNCIVTRNFIQNFTASCTKAMTFTSSSNGQISENKMQILSGTAPITGAAMSWVGANYYAATIATAGTLI